LLVVLLLCGAALRIANAPVKLPKHTSPFQRRVSCRSAVQLSAFTKYCFTSKLYCGSLSSFYCPPPTTCNALAHCNTIACFLRNIRPPTDPPCVCHIPYTIGDGNIVQRPNQLPCSLSAASSLANAFDSPSELPNSALPATSALAPAAAARRAVSSLTPPSTWSTLRAG